MAYTFNLANVDRTNIYNLLQGPLSLVNRQWTTRITSPLRSSSMSEVMDLGTRYRGSGLATAGIADIETYIENSALYHSYPTVKHSQWLEWGIPGENPFRRSLLYEGAWEWLRVDNVIPFMDAHQALIRLALTRHPFWEDYTTTTISTNSVSCLGGMWTITNTEGRVPSRLYLTEFSAPAAQTDVLTRVWAGIRLEHEGYGSFDPVWENELIANGGNAIWQAADITDVNDAGGNVSNNWYASCDFSVDADLEPRIRITVQDVVGANYDHFIGRYLILLRARVTAGTVGIQLRSSYTHPAQAQSQGEEVYLDDTNYSDWELIELGEIQFPLEGEWEGTLADHLRRAGITLYAERVSGAGDLHMDCLILIPTAHLVYVDGAAISHIAGPPIDARPLKVITRENDTVAALQYWDETAAPAGDSFPYTGNVPEPANWSLPQGNSLLVLAAQRDGAHILGDTLDIDIEHYPRWLSYKEAV